MIVDTDKSKCPKCKEHFITIMGDSVQRLCRCIDPKRYDMIEKSFKIAFEDKENKNERN